MRGPCSRGSAVPSPRTARSRSDEESAPGSCVLPQHLEMRNVVFEVLVADRLETQLAIEALEPRLRADADRAARPSLHAAHNAFAHQGLAGTGAARFRRGDHAADRWLVVLHAGVDHAQISEQAARVIAAEQVPRVLIQAVRVLIGALLHDEDTAAQCERVIQRMHAELFKARPRELQTSFTNCLPKFLPLSRPRKASGALAMPCATVSRYFS